jgi:UDP-glucose 4-epimerase
VTAPLSWIVGAGGLLGSSVVAAIERRGPVWSPPEPIRWTDDDVHAQLNRAVRSFSVALGTRPWQVAWCAGAGTPSTSSRSVVHETDVFDNFLHSLESSTNSQSRDGSLFVASSAGGVYAGSRGAPFTESSVTAATSPYGQAKIHIENAATEWGQKTGIPVLIGRVSNVYGPRQNLVKSQGLISQVCRAYLLGQPTSIYVPLGTMRDYIFASDCGALVSESMIRLREEAARTGEPVHVKVIASQQTVTISLVLAELRRIFKRAHKVVYGVSVHARSQALDLRLRSEVWPELDKRNLTPLPAGIMKTVAGLTRVMQAGRLS